MKNKKWYFESANIIKKTIQFVIPNYLLCRSSFDRTKTIARYLTQIDQIGRLQYLR